MQLPHLNVVWRLLVFLINIAKCQCHLLLCDVLLCLRTNLPTVCWFFTWTLWVVSRKKWILVILVVKETYTYLLQYAFQLFGNFELPYSQPALPGNGNCPGTPLVSRQWLHGQQKSHVSQMECSKNKKQHSWTSQIQMHRQIVSLWFYYLS